MKFANTACLREKEVISLCDGSRLGCPEDFEVDIDCGKIIAIIVVGEAGLLGFGKRDEYVIPWDKIHCIGEDTILVKLDPSELRCCLREPSGKKKPPKNKL